MMNLPFNDLCTVLSKLPINGCWSSTFSKLYPWSLHDGRGVVAMKYNDTLACGRVPRVIDQYQVSPYNLIISLQLL